MNTPAGSNDNLDATAKLMQELSKASVELEKTVTVLSEQLMSFNESLERSFQEEVEAVKERMESSLRQSLDGLNRDKESVMKALSEFRQAEIDRIIMSGKTVRSGLSAQVEDSTRNLSAVVQGKIVGIRDLLNGPETDMKAKYEETQLSLVSNAENANNTLKNASAQEEARLKELDAEFDRKLAEQVAKGQQDFESLFLNKRRELESQGEATMSELARKYDEAAHKLESSFTHGQSLIEQGNQQSQAVLKQLADSGSSNLTQQSMEFSSNLQGLSTLLNGLFETRLNNLAAQSRTEIISVAQHAEETLSSIKVELQLNLKEFQRDYVAQFEALNAKLEKTLDELAKNGDSSGLRGLREDRVRDQLQSLFRRLGQEMIDTAASAAKSLEQEFQNSMDAFAQRIDSAKTQACEALESECKLMQRELSKSFQDFEKQFAEMQLRAAQLEKQGKDAANIVMTIRQANLEF